MTADLKLYFVLGEESGDALGADLLPALEARAEQYDVALTVTGLAGPQLKVLGMTSLFNIEDIAVMGITAVVGRLPSIVKRVNETVNDIVAQKPDVVILIDSPDFTHAVAKRVRKKMPGVPVVKYVCPSVWAWRSGRAAKMKAFVDHVLAILPFEPEVLRKLSGPASTYVGHPLARRIESLGVTSPPLPKNGKTNLLVLPGSRTSEVKRLLPLFGTTLDLLRASGVEFETIIPAVPHLRSTIEEQTLAWAEHPRIVDSADNDETFAKAHAALAASGTVALQLALHHVPMTLAYKLDPIARQAMPFMQTWSVGLPNHIAGWPLVPEDLNDMVIPDRMARTLARLLQDTPERRAQLDGFKLVSKRMKTKRPPAEIATDVIFDLVGLAD